jgi:hypothetical protein
MKLLKFGGKYRKVRGRFVQWLKRLCCCGPICPPNCGTPSTLCINDLTFYDSTGGIVAGPMDTSMDYIADMGWAVNGAIPGMTCTHNAFTVVLHCNELALTGPGGLYIVTCSQTYRIDFTIQCCNDAFGPSAGSGCSSMDGFQPILPVSGSPLEFDVDMPMCMAGGLDACIMDNGIPVQVSRVTCTIKECP